MLCIENQSRALTDDEWRALADEWLRTEAIGRRVLLVPPDYSRCHSYAGEITAYLYSRLKDAHEVRVMPAVGTHVQMTDDEKRSFFPNVPEEAFMEHRWQSDTASLGSLSAQEVSRLTGGEYTAQIEVLTNRHLAQRAFDTVVSIGQVVPHEVAGFANYTKNLLIGLGGRDMINRSHMVGAIHGIENCLGCVDTPVRAIFDEAQRRFLDPLGVTFFLTVTTRTGGHTRLNGLMIGKQRDVFERAAALSQQLNVTWLPMRVKKIVAYLEPDEFKSTWIGNKAIYRTRMAIADGGELLVLAPGVQRLGENAEIDRLIRAYGYRGTKYIRALYDSGAFKDADMAAAHLMHGSSEGRFSITYATDPALLSREDVEGVGFNWADVRQALERYRPDEKETGEYEENGERYYFVKAPGMGLWKAQ